MGRFEGNMAFCLQKVSVQRLSNKIMHGFRAWKQTLEGSSAADVWEIHGSDGLLDDGVMTKMLRTANDHFQLQEVLR